jgi:hypothetical protein
MNETDTVFSSGLYIPCFKKIINNEKIDFLNGLCVNKDANTTISDTLLNSEVAIHGKHPSEASLKFLPDDNSYLIDEDYIFVLTHPDLENGVKIPFVCGLVSQKDWLKA